MRWFKFYFQQHYVEIAMFTCNFIHLFMKLSGRSISKHEQWRADFLSCHHIFKYTITNLSSGRRNEKMKSKIYSHWTRRLLRTEDPLRVWWTLIARLSQRYKALYSILFTFHVLLTMTVLTMTITPGSITIASSHENLSCFIVDYILNSFSW